MALPTPNSEITATVDPQPIADAIAKAIDAVVQPLIKVMDNVGSSDDTEMLEEIGDQADGSKLTNDLLQEQIALQSHMADRLEGIFNFTRGTETNVHSLAYDGVQQRKNPEKLDAIREAILKSNFDGPVIPVAQVGKSDATLEKEAQEGADIPDADKEEEGQEEQRHYLKEIADNTKIMADGVKEAAEATPDLIKPNEDDQDDPNEKEDKEKSSGDGVLGGIMKEIGGFLKLFAKIAGMVALFAAAVFAANDSVFVKLKELFQRLVQVIAPIIKTLMENVLPPLIDVLMLVADAFMQVVEALMPPILNLVEQVMPPLMDLLVTIIDVFMQVVEMVMPKLTQVIEAALPPLVDLIKLVADLFLMIVDLLLPVVEPMITFVAESLVAVFGFIGDLISGITRFFSDPIGYLQDGISYVADGGDMILVGIANFINGLIEFIAGLVEKIPFVGEGAARGLRSMKVNFGKAAEERMEKRAAQRTERAYDRVVDEMDFSMSANEFQEAVAAKIEAGDFSAEIGQMLIDRHAKQQETSGGGTSGTPTGAGSDATQITSLSGVDMPEFDAEGMVQIPLPGMLQKFLGDTSALVSKTPVDGKFHLYKNDGTPITSVIADEPVGQIIGALAQEKGLDPSVAEATSIDSTQMPVDAAELPTGGATVSTATSDLEETQALAAAGGDVAISPTIVSQDQSTNVINQKNSTGVIHTGGGSSLGGRDTLLPG